MLREGSGRLCTTRGSAITTMATILTTVVLSLLAVVQGPSQPPDQALDAFEKECVAGHASGCSGLTGATELTRAFADLDRDGLEDALLVLERQKTRPSDPEILEKRRPLLVLIRQSNGSLRLEKRNDTIVCSACEDVDEPIAAEAGGFVVTRVAWGLTRHDVQYAFAHSRRDKTWQLVRVEEKALVDPTGDTMTTTAVWSPPAHFGKIDVADFDPDNWKGQGEGYRGLPTPVGPIRVLVGEVRRLLGEGSDLAAPLQEALDALDAPDRKSNADAEAALRAFAVAVRSGTRQPGRSFSAADAQRLGEAAEAILRRIGSAAPATQGAPALATYRSERLGASFLHPARWIVGDCPQRPSCVAVYRRRADLGTDLYVAALEFVAAGLPEAAARAGFQQQAGAWILQGRFGPSKAEAVSAPAWKGLQVRQACPTSDATTGFHAAGGECLTAVLSEGRRSVLVDTPGDPPPGVELDALLRSLRFLPPGR